MFKRGLVLLSLLLGSPIFADVTVTGPLSVPVYTMVKLTATDVPAKSVVFWDVTPEDPADVEEFNAGKDLRFTAPPGKYKVKLRVVNLENLGVTTQRFDVTIGDGKPIPPGPPVPPNPDPPNPTPVKPGFAIIVRDLNNVTQDEGSVITDPAFHKGLADRGVTYRLFSHTDAEAIQKYKAQWDKVGLPMLLVTSAGDAKGKVKMISAQRLPATTTSALATVDGGAK